MCVQEAQRRAKAEKKAPGGKVGEGAAVERQSSSAGGGKAEPGQEDHSKVVVGQRGSSHKITKSSSQV